MYKGTPVAYNLYNDISKIEAITSEELYKFYAVTLNGKTKAYVKTIEDAESLRDDIILHEKAREF